MAKTAKTFSIQYIGVNEDFWWKLTGKKIHKDEKIATDYIVRNTKIKAEKLELLSIHYAKNSFLIAGGVLFFILSFFFIRGRISSKKLHISGNQIAPAWKVALRLRLTRQASPIHLGKHPFAKGTETRHSLVTGGTGSGKTNCFNHLLPQIRSQGQRAIIIDTTGTFTERYFNENSDTLYQSFR